MSYQCSVLTGDETGLLKYIRFNESNNLITSYGEQSRSRAIIGLDWVERNKTSTVLRANAELELWNIESDGDDNEGSNDGEKDRLTLTKQIRLEQLSKPVGCVICKTNNSSSASDKLISYGHDGTSLIIDLLRFKVSHTLNLNGPISCGNINSDGASYMFAYGGNENDLKIFDLNSLTNR